MASQRQISTRRKQHCDCQIPARFLFARLVAVKIYEPDVNACFTNYRGKTTRYSRESLPPQAAESVSIKRSQHSIFLNPFYASSVNHLCCRKTSAPSRRRIKNKTTGNIQYRILAVQTASIRLCLPVPSPHLHTRRRVKGPQRRPLTREFESR